MGNFYRFRNIYFHASGYGGYQYKPNQGAKEAIMDKVSRQAFSIRKADCLDLPDRVFETRYIYMDEAQQNAYDMMKKENILEFEGHVTLGANELAKICKLREITGGFVITTQGLPVKISDSKINVLKELLEEIPEDKQAIIWIQYHWESNEIKKMLGDEAVILNGTIPQKEKESNIELFKQGKKRFLIAHPKSGGHGLNLQNAGYTIWFSLSYSYEEYGQACDRNYRIGTNQKVTYFHLLAKDTIDEVIYKAVSGKKNLSEACLNMLKGINQNGI
jgi:SNF2 family DNA or RNA helicase